MAGGVGITTREECGRGRARREMPRYKSDIKHQTSEIRPPVQRQGRRLPHQRRRQAERLESRSQQSAVRNLSALRRFSSVKNVTGSRRMTGIWRLLCTNRNTHFGSVRRVQVTNEIKVASLQRSVQRESKRACRKRQPCLYER
jgi:hypothetical protein